MKKYFALLLIPFLFIGCDDDESDSLSELFYEPEECRVVFTELENDIFDVPLNIIYYPNGLVKSIHGLDTLNFEYISNKEARVTSPDNENVINLTRNGDKIIAEPVEISNNRFGREEYTLKNNLVEKYETYIGSELERKTEYIRSNNMLTINNFAKSENGELMLESKDVHSEPDNKNVPNFLITDGILPFLKVLTTNYKSRIRYFYNGDGELSDSIVAESSYEYNEMGYPLITSVTENESFNSTLTYIYECD